MKKQQLLNEIMGVPKAIDFWVESLSLVISGMAKGIVDNDEIEESTTNYTNLQGEEVEESAYRGRTEMSGKEFNNWVIKLNGYSDLKQLLEDPKFKQFPLYQPSVGLEIYFLPDELYDMESDSGKRILIEASHGFNPSKKLISKIGNNMIITNQRFTFKVTTKASDLDNLDLDFFIKNLKPVVSHELTHAYEAFNRIKVTEDPYQGRESSLNAAVSLMNDAKYPQWNRFLMLVYLHLSFEINARVTQLYYELKEKDIDNQEEFLKLLKESNVWASLEALENFNTEEFIESFSVRGGKTLWDMIEDLGVQNERQEGGLPRIDLKEIPNEGMKHLISGWNYLLQVLNKELIKQGVYKGKLMDMVPEKAMEDPYYFFKFFEKRFHKKAENFKRKLYRIGSLILDKDLIGESTEELDWVNIESNPAEEFLYQKFTECKLEKAESNWVGWSRYVDTNGKSLFADNINSGDQNPVLWLDYEIYKKLSEMGLDFEYMTKLCIDLLYQTYNRKVSQISLARILP